MNIFTILTNYREQLIQRIRTMDEVLSNSPEGMLRHSQKGRYDSYIIRKTVEGKRISRTISPKDALFNSYADKYYAQKMLPHLRANLAAADAFLKRYSGWTEREVSAGIDRRIIDSSHLAEHAGIMSREKWMSQFEANSNPAEKTAPVASLRGDLLRSKSEVIIADSLLHAYLDYLCECPLKLRDRINRRTIIKYPDFLIRHPKTGMNYIWEHFGKMGDPDYAYNAVTKLMLYADNGYILGKNMIATFESADAPFSSHYADIIIKAYFMD